MLSSPQGFWGGPDPGKIEARFQDLEAKIAAVLQRNNRGVGATSIQNPQGVTTFFSGPSVFVVDPAGAPQWVTFFKDAAGQVRWELFDPDPIANGYVQALWEWDHLGNLIRTTDVQGGWAEPWLPIVMYPKFSPPAGVYAYRTTNVNVAEQQLWEGRASYVSHPQIQINGVWGAGSGTNTTRYRLKVGGNTVATWDVAGLEVSIKGPFSLLLPGVVIGTRNSVVELTAQSLSGTGTYACQVLACDLRQS